ncbi:R3H domain-containing nucleic acid-binding protein [Knoellia sp. p5-6-4]|uniref:Jag family protein n=1 Tax=unclassified Knoellia TaxID=2618719 RepID=UPI0023DAB636|nr:R3H domain-containing nucleic acid-binding protein [Knoellia sp. p5-6-4]MDF2145103.1 RNA-binding protein [Knoellia sp. p5-6-4]
MSDQTDSQTQEQGTEQDGQAPTLEGTVDSHASVPTGSAADVADSLESVQSTESASEAGAAQARGGRRQVADLEREGEVAADFLETLLDIADLDGDIDVDVDGDRAAVAIVDSEEGRVPRRLVGSDGKVLEALQELTRLAVQSATGERSRLLLDVAGHRAERRAELVGIAREAVAEVRASGEKKSLSPMSAFERKVVHDEVLAAGLASESEGTEPHRRVVVLPA